MSARQNKKQRKGRNNPNNRERTVTTLTEDPNTPYLVPTPSEEPAGANLMSSPFSVASSSTGNPNNIPATGYQMPANFAFGYGNFVGPMHGGVHHQQHQQPQQFFPQQQQPILPPGQNDLEVLEKLKDMIKSGQHEFFRAIPQPAALAGIYLGPNATPQAQALHHSEQAPADLHTGHPLNNSDSLSQAHPPGNSDPSSPIDLGRRPPRIQNKEGWDPSGSRKSAGPSTANGSQPTNNVLSAPSPDVFSSANPPQFSQSNQASHPQGQGGHAPSAINTSNVHSNGSTNNNSVGPPPGSIKSTSDLHSSSEKPSSGPSRTGGPDATPPQRSATIDATTSSRPTGLPSSLSNTKLDQPRPSDDRLGHGESVAYGGARSGPRDVSPDKNAAFDGKDDGVRPSREGGWLHRDSMPPLDDRRREPDRAPLPLSARPANAPSNGPDARPSIGSDRPLSTALPPRDQRFYDRDRERDRDRDRDRDREIWERDRDRRPDFRFRDDRHRMTDVRRPPPEQRHYEPDYDRSPIPRRYDSKLDDSPASGRRLSDARPPLPSDDRAVRPLPPVEDRPSRPLADDRLPPNRAPPGVPRSSVDARLPHPDTRALTSDSRAPPAAARGPPGDDRRGPPPNDDRTTRPPPPAARPVESPGTRTAGEDRSVRAPAPPVSSTEDRSSRPQVPLEDRISRPSLQDRLSQPPSARADTTRLVRQPSLDERLSTPTATPSDHTSNRSLAQPDDRLRPSGNNVTDLDRDRANRLGPSDERNGRAPIGKPAPRPPLPQDNRPRLDDRVPRYGGPLTPEGDVPRSSAYPPPRSASVVRDDLRVPIKRSPSPRRDFRPPFDRDVSRERPSTYRPDVDRSYPPERRDIMDVDPPSRFADNRQPYRRFSPPSAADLARDRARTQYPPPSPPRASIVDAPYDDDRRHAGPGGRDWQYYTERRREWSAADEDSYWKARPQWDRANPPLDRDRLDRDAPPPRNHGWETREERQQRDAYPPRTASPTRSFDGPPRPLSSRLTDAYPGSAPGPSDGRYPPLSRDLDRPRPGASGFTPPPSLVRARSPSPLRRPGPSDDTRPPMKRPREDAYSSDYYPTHGRDPPPRRPGADYPPRGLSPPPSSGGSYYDNRGGPPPSSAATTATATTAGASDPDYVGGRDRGLDYLPPGSYDRPRSPPLSRPAQGYPRGGFNRGSGDPREERRFMHPPPPRAS